MTVGVELRRQNKLCIRDANPDNLQQPNVYGCVHDLCLQRFTAFYNKSI